MPDRLFGRWLLVWHTMYLSLLVIVFTLTLRQNQGVWGQDELILLGMVAVQVLLYVGVFIRPGPAVLPKEVLAVYFVVSIGLWMVEAQQYPTFWWLSGAYIGQIAGILAPKTAAFAFLLFFFAMSYTNNPERGINGLLRDIQQNWIEVFLTLGSFFVLYLYIYHIAKTSHERGKLIASLEAAQEHLERARQQEAELAVLQERERLARDLHDTLGHTLVVLSVQLEAVQRLYRVDAEKASAMLDTLKQLTRDSTESLRRSLTGLRTPGLGEQPLRQALYTLSLETSQRTGLQVQCEVAETADSLHPALAETIWRITQEALTNIEKHAQAHQVTIRLTAQPNQAVLWVSDDGVGITAETETLPGHYGLRGMKERIVGMGGTLTLDNHNGTHLQATFPLY